MYKDYYVKGKKPADILGFEETLMFSRFGFDKRCFDQYLLEKKESMSAADGDDKLFDDDGGLFDGYDYQELKRLIGDWTGEDDTEEETEKVEKKREKEEEVEVDVEVEEKEKKRKRKKKRSNVSSTTSPRRKKRRVV